MGGGGWERNANSGRNASRGQEGKGTGERREHGIIGQSANITPFPPKIFKIYINGNFKTMEKQLFAKQ